MGCLHPPDRRHGFSFWYSYGIRDDHFEPRYWVGDAAWNEPTTVREWSPRHEADVAISFIRNHPTVRDPNKPFGLFVAMNPPHPPWEMVPEEYLDPYHAVPIRDLLVRPNVDLRADNPQLRAAVKGVRGYFGAITGVDDQVGRILRCLDEEGLAARTIVLFTSDHGEMLGSHGMIGKSVWYEESIGIPFILRWRGVIPPRKENLLVSVPDVMPTLLGLMGLASRIPAAVQGQDLSALFLGKRSARPDFAIYREPGTIDMGARGIRTSRYTFVHRRRIRGGTVRYLFDNEHDPYQMRNIVDEAPALAEELYARMRSFLVQIGDPWARAPSR